MSTYNIPAVCRHQQLNLTFITITAPAQLQLPPSLPSFCLPSRALITIKPLFLAGRQSVVGAACLPDRWASCREQPAGARSFWSCCFIPP